MAGVSAEIPRQSIDKRRGRRAIDLPAPVTLAFLPYASELAEQTAQARARGHELLVHVNMEPTDRGIDPGPKALLTSLSPAEIRERMNKAAEGKEAVNIYDTKDNAARLTKATGG